MSELPKNLGKIEILAKCPTFLKKIEKTDTILGYTDKIDDV